jgi:hypothetical protein
LAPPCEPDEDRDPALELRAAPAEEEPVEPIPPDGRELEGAW